MEKGQDSAVLDAGDWATGGRQQASTANFMRFKNNHTLRRTEATAEPAEATAAAGGTTHHALEFQSPRPQRPPRPQGSRWPWMMLCGCRPACGADKGCLYLKPARGRVRGGPRALFRLPRPSSACAAGLAAGLAAGWLLSGCCRPRPRRDQPMARSSLPSWLRTAGSLPANARLFSAAGSAVSTAPSIHTCGLEARLHTCKDMQPERLLHAGTEHAQCEERPGSDACNTC